METQTERSRGGSEEVLHDILSMVADAEGTDPAELTPPLYDVLDTDALERVLESGDESMRVTFEYRSWEIEVRADGTVTLEPLTDGT